MSVGGGVVYWIHSGTDTNPKIGGYIGITNKYKIRLKGHIRDAKNGTHCNKKLSMLINSNEYTVDIIFTGPMEGCSQIEEYLRPNVGIGLNIVAGGKDNSGQSNPMYNKNHTDSAKALMRAKKLGNKMSDEAKKNMSISRKGKPKPSGFGANLSRRQLGGRNHQSISVVCVNTGEMFYSYVEAAERFGITWTKVSRSVSTGFPTRVEKLVFKKASIEKKR